MPTADLKTLYNDACFAPGADLRSGDTNAALLELVSWSHTFLIGRADRKSIASKVPGKSYFTFSYRLRGRQKRSRAVNAELFAKLDPSALPEAFAAKRDGKAVQSTGALYCGDV